MSPRLFDFAKPLPQFQTPDAPIIRTETKDEEEQRLVRSLSDNLGAMQSQCANLIADVTLFDHCQQHPQASLREWMFLAGRDGAMALRNFAEALKAARALVGRCPSIAGSINTQALKEADATFKSQFPRVEKLRHAAAHPEFYANPEKDMATREPVPMISAEPGNSITVQGSLMGRRYTSTINGLTVDWEISAQTATALLEITKKAFDTFSEVDIWKRRSAPPQRGLS